MLYPTTKASGHYVFFLTFCRFNGMGQGGEGKRSQQSNPANYTTPSLSPDQAEPKSAESAQIWRVFFMGFISTEPFA